MELLADTPRTTPNPSTETFPIGFANTKCYRCRRNLQVGTTGGWLIKPNKRIEDIDHKDDKVHYECWWDRVWYFQHGMCEEYDREPPVESVKSLNDYDRPKAMNETLTKQMIDRQYQEDPMERKHPELISQIDMAIEDLMSVKRFLEDLRP